MFCRPYIGLFMVHSITKCIGICIIKIIIYFTIRDLSAAVLKSSVPVCDCTSLKNTALDYSTTHR
jgi:hypothetical protein